MNAPAEQFISTYTGVYGEAGYPTAPPGGIYVQDGSTVFASCTVSNYRGALRNEAVAAGGVMVQKSFRTRTLDQLHAAVHPSRRALFDMYGGFETATETDISAKILLHSRLMQTVLQECGIDAPNIALMADKTDWDRWDIDATASGFSSYTYPNGPKSNLPRRAGKIIKEYGEGITGHGIEVFVRSPSGTWNLCGNVVETIGADGSTSGIDYGGGLEATAVALHGPAAAYLDTEMCVRYKMPLKTDNERLLNLLEAFESLMIMRTYEPEPHPLSVTVNPAAYAARAVLLQSYSLGINDDELRTLGENHGDTPLTSTPSIYAALQEVYDRISAIKAFKNRASNSNISNKLLLRRRQAERQGHPFDTTHEAKYVVEQMHKLPADVRAIVPTQLLPEELIVVN